MADMNMMAPQDWVDYERNTNAWKKSVDTHKLMLAAFQAALLELGNIDTEIAFAMLPRLLVSPVENDTQKLAGLGHSINVTGNYREVLSKAQDKISKFLSTPPGSGYDDTVAMREFATLLKEMRAKVQADEILDPANKANIVSAINTISSQFNVAPYGNAFENGDGTAMAIIWRTKFLDPKDPFAPSRQISAISSAQQQISTAYDAAGAGLNTQVQYVAGMVDTNQGTAKGNQDKYNSNIDNIINNLRPR